MQLTQKIIFYSKFSLLSIIYSVFSLSLEYLSLSPVCLYILLSSSLTSLPISTSLSLFLSHKPLIFVHSRSREFLLCLKPFITMVAPFSSSPFRFKFFSLISLHLLGYINGVYSSDRWVGVGFQLLVAIGGGGDGFGGLLVGRRLWWV